MTPTAGHQFDVPPVRGSVSAAGLAADCDVLRLVEGHLTPHLAGLARGAEADVGLDVQRVRLRLQQLPQVRLVAAPAAPEEPDLFMFACKARGSGASAGTLSPLVSILRY